MRRTTTILIAALLTAGALAPVAAAGWKYRGTNEPDTSYDVDFMWAAHDTDPDQDHRQVYMSGFQHSGMLWVNPNSGALGSRMQQVASTEHSVLLGVWKDCNGDGYIGFGEAGLMEYRSTLLTDTSVCPVTNVDVNNPPSPYPFNDGGWVRELNWIGDRMGKIGAADSNPTVTVIPGTQVWFDHGLPNAVPGTSCPISGGQSFRNVGGVLQWSDCFTNYQGIRNLNNIQAQTGLPTGGWDEEDVRNSPAFLNIATPGWDLIYGADGDGFDDGALGRDNHDNDVHADRMFTVYDCSDRTNPVLSPGTTVDTSGSAYESMNETYNVLTSGKCKADQPNSVSNNAFPYPMLESQTEGQSAAAGKDEVSDLFIFSYGNRRLAPAVTAGPLGPYGPVDGGLALERDLDTIGPAWRANTGWTTTPMLVNRDGLEPTSGQYVTYYAKLGATTGLEIPGNGPYRYGPCAETQTTGRVNDWHCDKAKWEARCLTQGADIRNCVTIGEAYHLRDVDCVDNRLTAVAPVYASLAQFSADGPCASGPQTTIEP